MFFEMQPSKKNQTFSNYCNSWSSTLLLQKNITHFEKSWTKMPCFLPTKKLFYSPQFLKTFLHFFPKKSYNILIQLNETTDTLSQFKNIIQLKSYISQTQLDNISRTIMRGLFVLVQISLPGCFVGKQVTPKYSGSMLCSFVFLEITLLSSFLATLIAVKPDSFML